MNAYLSVDVEDWFQVENLKQVIHRDSWNKYESRVEKNVNLILDLLEEKKTKATFFVLGWIAEKHPALIRLIYDQGHEIACHGYNHELVYSLSVDDFRKDVLLAKNILENIIGNKIIGYRAPNFSITDDAIDILSSLGFKYDSSLFPILLHNRYGRLREIPGSKSSYFEIRKNFMQMKLSYFEIGKLKLPWAGGFYFRFIPYNIFRFGVKKILQKENFYLFYIHPWEFDPEQPRIDHLKMNYKFRHYTNLSKTEIKFKKLIRDFEFCPIRKIIPQFNHSE